MFIEANLKSEFVNEKHWIPGKFEWQTGFGAFSYSHSEISTVIEYIQNQEVHHHKKTFKEEYLEFLNEFEIDFKNEFIFEDI